MNDVLENTANDHDRLKVLDGLRAIAILLVIIMHSLRDFRPDQSVPMLPVSFFDLSALLYNGWIGVYLFFVLSGFLIGCQLIRLNLTDNRNRYRSLLYFFKVRFFRIAPAYYVTLPAIILFLYAVPSLEDGSFNQQVLVAWITRMIVHIFFLQDYIPPPLAAYLWSLAVEAKFYLVSPFLILALFTLGELRTRLLALIGLAATLVVLRTVTVLTIPETFHGYDSYFFLIQARFHLSLDALLAGLGCALLWSNQRAREYIQNPAIANICFISGCLWIFVMTAIQSIGYPLKGVTTQILLPTFLAVAFSLVMMGLLGRCRGYRIFENKPFRWIAMISYSLYLTHGFCLWFQKRAIDILSGDNTSPEISSIYWFATLPVFFLSAFCIAYLLYRYVEKPFIDWSKKKTLESA